MSDTLEHYGVKRRSGRYEWGSGKNPQRSKDILSKVDEMRGRGLSEKEIASALGLNTAQLRTEIAWANKVRKEVLIDTVTSMNERGLSRKEISEKTGLSVSSVGNYLSSEELVKVQQLDNISAELKKNLAEYEYIDVGVGVERQMGISRTKLKNAVAKLKEEGYVEHEIYVKRLDDPSKWTTVKVLTKEKDLEIVKKNADKIHAPNVYFEEGGLNAVQLGPIQKVDWNRVEINYGDKGGSDKDGVIELRRGVKDLDLGNSNYAQVRIKVGNDHYLKGMAMYSDNMPAGKDILFNTNKKSGTDPKDVLKPLKKGQDNPFGATIKAGGQKGALNIVNEEGDWDKWATQLSAQFLSKQPTALVKDRLDATFKKVQNDFKEITGLTNPLVKKHLLDAYINELDSKANHMKALGLPKTKSHVILPLTSMNPSEVYAPNYKNGEKVVLIRYPHGGTFELPELTVNNKSTKGRSLLGNALDAIGIHPSVASKLSGADFDGDTVYVIPNNNRKIKTSRSLKELKNFDPNIYKVDRITITPKGKQTQMGKVSNLITDMTIKGAPQSEIARAVRHSMVVIDSEKHKLDWKKSAADNGIRALQKKYQTHINPVTGKKSVAASTIISKKKQVESYVTNPITGKKKKVVNSLYDLVGGDARKLSSGSAVENLYADYVNKVLAQKGTAMKAALKIAPVKRNPAAAKKYAKEVSSLANKLNTALSNAPKERQAQIMSVNTYYKNLSKDMDKDARKKLKSQALAGARAQVGSKKVLVSITDKEWTAIQAGAISNNMLDQILKNSDMDKVKKLATPKTTKSLTSAKVSRAKALLASGKYTYAEVAEAVGVSVSTLRDNMA